jgi:hypothetical protein
MSSAAAATKVDARKTSTSSRPAPAARYRPVTTQAHGALDAMRFAANPRSHSAAAHAADNRRVY